MTTGICIASSAINKTTDYHESRLLAFSSDVGMLVRCNLFTSDMVLAFFKCY